MPHEIFRSRRVRSCPSHKTPNYGSFTYITQRGLQKDIWNAVFFSKKEKKNTIKIKLDLYKYPTPTNLQKKLPLCDVPWPSDDGFELLKEGECSAHHMKHVYPM